MKVLCCTGLFGILVKVVLFAFACSGLNAAKAELGAEAAYDLEWGNTCEEAVMDDAIFMEILPITSADVVIHLPDDQCEQ